MGRKSRTKREAQAKATPPAKAEGVLYRMDDGALYTHREAPSRRWQKVRRTGPTGKEGADPCWENWENNLYYGTLRCYPAGFPLGGGPHAVIGITSVDETARHDFRDYQRIKNDLVGDEWEAVELYPAESRLSDPSNRFFLWCVPKGVFAFGFMERNVLQPGDGPAPQRPFPETEGRS